jgi:hypothetical protein
VRTYDAVYQNESNEADQTMPANMTRVSCARIIGAYEDALGNRNPANVSIEGLVELLEYWLRPMTPRSDQNDRRGKKLPIECALFFEALSEAAGMGEPHGKIILLLAEQDVDLIDGLVVTMKDAPATSVFGRTVLSRPIISAWRWRTECARWRSNTFRTTDSRYALISIFWPRLSIVMIRPTPYNAPCPPLPPRNGLSWRVLPGKVTRDGVYSIEPRPSTAERIAAPSALV